VERVRSMTSGSQATISRSRLLRFPSASQRPLAKRLRFRRLVHHRAHCRLRPDMMMPLPPAMCYFVTIIRKVEKEDRASLDGWAIAS
jgi:hypothetical protein